MPGPLTGMRTETGWAGGDARDDLPVRPGQPAYRRQSRAPATWRTGHVRGDGSPLPLTGPARGVALYPVARGASRWL
jgi:hypothetical protein